MDYKRKIEDFLNRWIWPFSKIHSLKNMLFSQDKEIGLLDSKIMALCRDIRILSKTLSDSGVSIKYHTPERNRPIQIHWGVSQPDISIDFRSGQGLPPSQAAISYTTLNPEILVVNAQIDQLKGLSEETKEIIVKDILNGAAGRLVSKITSDLHPKTVKILEDKRYD
jgi:hypothetical protein